MLLLCSVANKYSEMCLTNPRRFEWVKRQIILGNYTGQKLSIRMYVKVVIRSKVFKNCETSP